MVSALVDFTRERRVSVLTILYISRLVAFAGCSPLCGHFSPRLKSVFRLADGKDWAAECNMLEGERVIPF